MDKKRGIVLFLILAVTTGLFELAFADTPLPCPECPVEDSMVFETYYPSPYGLYEELRGDKIIVGDTDGVRIQGEATLPPSGTLTFNPLSTDPSGNLYEGSLYYQGAIGGTKGKFRFYDGSDWQDLGGGGDWEKSGSNISNTNSGNIGIGTNNPVEKLDISGGLRINNTAALNAGTIRWTGSDFEGYDGTVWLSLTGKKSYLETKCTGQGGSFESPQGLCYFSGSSCLAGWKRYKSYGSASACSCWNSCGNSSSAPAFYRVDASLSGCSVDTPYWYCWPANKSCSQSWSEVGCMPE